MRGANAAGGEVGGLSVGEADLIGGAANERGEDAAAVEKLVAQAGFGRGAEAEGDGVAAGFHATADGKGERISDKYGANTPPAGAFVLQRGDGASVGGDDNDYDEDGEENESDASARCGVGADTRDVEAKLTPPLLEEIVLRHCGGL